MQAGLTYSGEHSIKISTRQYDGVNYNAYVDTWKDLQLIPSSRPYVKPPEVKEEYVEIPGMMGALDYTELLSHQPIFSNRKGSWEFMLPNLSDGVDRGMSWAEELSKKFLMPFHGKKCRIILSDDPLHYYNGRIKINDYKKDKERSTIVFDYNLEPYKNPIATAEEEEWQWNQLFGLNSIIYGAFDVTVSKMRTLINNYDEPIHIGTDTNAPFTIYKYASEEAEEPSGTPIHINAGVINPADSLLVIDPGKTKVKFSGTGHVKLFYTEGRML